METKNSEEREDGKGRYDPESESEDDEMKGDIDDYYKEKKVYHKKETKLP